MARDGKTHIFRGKTVVEAMAKARNKLGKDFSIVNRRDIRESNLFSKLTQGKLGGDALSVELEVAELPPERPGSGGNGGNGKNGPIAPNPLLKSYAKAQEGAEKHSLANRQAMAAAAAPFATIGESASGLAGRLEDFQKTLEKNTRDSAKLRDELLTLISLQARGGVPLVGPELLAHYRKLVDADVRDDLARDMLESVQREFPGLSGEKEILSALRVAVARRFPSAGPVLPAEGKPTVVALAGPSGVGKSTSIVKLAIHFSMHKNMSVSVINEDLSRPGADGQINNLGRLFGIPVVTAHGAREVADIVRTMASRDIILLDTGGRSPRDAAGIAELGEIVKAAGADETHLLLSSVSAEKTMTETVARYRPAGFNRIILTKLDECVSFGGLLNVASGLAHGLSYVTTGPDYSRPIQPADSLQLADLVLGLSEIAVEAREGRPT